MCRLLELLPTLDLETAELSAIGICNWLLLLMIDEAESLESLEPVELLLYGLFPLGLRVSGNLCKLDDNHPVKDALREGETAGATEGGFMLN
jgi:hypothetical protein